MNHATAPVSAKELSTKQVAAQRAQQPWKVETRGLHPAQKLRDVFRYQRFYGTVEFICSDVEAYDLFSVLSGSNALYLLAMGIRTQQEAIQTLEKHKLEYLIEDNSELAQKALERGIPAYPAMSLASFYGTGSKDKPEYLDALEANGISTLRKMIRYYPTVPDLIMKGEVSLADIKEIGVTRVVKAGRFEGSVIQQLKMLKSGKSAYDLQTMKTLIVRYEHEPMVSPLADPLSMAQFYGAEMVLGLYDFPAAAAYQSNFLTKEFTKEQRGEIIAFHDKLSRYYFSRELDFSDITYLYKHGVTVNEVLEGFRAGLPLNQIAGMSNNVSSSVSSGWL